MQKALLRSEMASWMQWEMSTLSSQLWKWPDTTEVSQQLQNSCRTLSGAGLASVQQFSLSRELAVFSFNQNRFSWKFIISGAGVFNSQSSTFLYPLDAGNPVYFYEFQHRPSSVEGVVPEFVKADHGAEIAFVFGKPFLAGVVPMLTSYSF